MTSTFLALLSAYYLCDAAAALIPLPPDTAQACAANYEAVKARFQTEGARAPADRRIAYLRFKAWEAENPALVSRLRKTAEQDARQALFGTKT